MSTLTSIEGAVQTRDPQDLASDRYEWLTLDQAEPNPGVPDSDGALFASNIDGTRLFTTEPRLSGLSFKANSLEEIPAAIPQYYLVLKGNPTDTTDDSVGWTLGTFEEVDTLQTVTDRGNITTQDIQIANLLADSAIFQGGVTIYGDLTVNGTQTIINSTTLTVDDKNIVIAEGAPDATSANGAGITVDGANATITYNSSTDRWELNKDLDVNNLYLGNSLVFDGAGAQDIINLNGALGVRTSSYVISDVAGTNTYASFEAGAILLDEILTVSDSATMEGKVFLEDVPPKEENVKVLFRRSTDGLVMEGEITVPTVSDVDKVKAEDTDSDALHYLLFTYANNGTGGFDSAYIDVSDLTYNPFTNTVTLENLVATGFTDLDSTKVEGDFQIKTTNPGTAGSTGGRLLDSDGRSFVVYDSAGRLLWGNNGLSAGNVGGGPVAVVSLNDLSDVVISSPSSGQVLKYDGTNWVNGTDNTASGGSGSQNVFTNIAVSGQSDIVADTTTDTVTFAGTGGIVITTNPASDTITIDGSGISGGGGSGTLASRTTHSVTTSTLADNAQENVNISDAYPTYALLKIQTNQAAWVRLYTDTTSRINDASRLITDDPAPDAGVIAEVITTGAQTIKMSPGVIGWNENADTTIPIRVQNLSGGSATITVTLTALELEA